MACIHCKQPFTDQNVRTEAGWRETKISGFCELCFDNLFGEKHEDEEIEDDTRYLLDRGDYFDE